MSSGASTSDPVARTLAWARGTFDTAKQKLAAMTKPARVMLLSTVAAAIVITAYFGYRGSQTTWGTLFANLDREDASAVVSKLKEMKVPYRVEGEGGTIEVPTQNVRELRLELAGSGLPRGGGVGFESFDKMRLGATEFEQRVLYRRSLEGELSRTIDTIQSVQSSRVHLVLPERSVFVGRAEPASASVVLKLRPGRVLGASEVAGVVHLVAASVASLTPDRVAIVTTDGTVLHKPRREGEVGGADGDEQVSTARALETTLEERTRSMLEKVIGVGRVDVRVSAELDRSRVERVEDRYDPKAATLRSEQSTTERTSPDKSATGVPGAESNLPEGAGKVDGGAGQEGLLRESHTRNFEVDHVVEKRLLTSGTLRRLTVAVVVDGHNGPRSKEEMDRLTGLVRSAVGADDKRGDLVTVESVPFLAVEPTVEPLPPSIVPDRFRKYVPYAYAGGAGLAFLTALITLWRVSKGLKKARAAREAKALLAPTEVKALVVAEPKDEPGDPHEVEIARIISKLDPDELRTRAHDRAADDPATAALVLRFWLGEGNDRNEPALPNGAAKAPAAALAEGIRIA
jgi:flagellar M-ring protein FliF